MLRILPPDATHFSRKFIQTIAIVMIGVVGVYFTSEFILESDTKGLGLKGLGLMFGGCVLFAFVIKILANWRQGLYIFFGWLFFEDFFRKYLGNNMAIYFAKDVLVLLVFLVSFSVRCVFRSLGVRHLSADAERSSVLRLRFSRQHKGKRISG